MTEEEYKSLFPEKTVCYHCDEQLETYTHDELIDHYKWIHDFDSDLTFEQLYVRLKTMGVL